jgi:non-homologous end joining protein Ku
LFIGSAYRYPLRIWDTSKGFHTSGRPEVFFESGAKPDSLPATALKQTKQCAIGRWTSRGKEHIIAIRPINEGLAMHQLHFQAEVQTTKELGIEVAPVSDAELVLANQLIQQLAAERFNPNNFPMRIVRGRKPLFSAKSKEVSWLHRR